jgi:serine phosphatase RsbU (regulator of sigma subunit)
VWIGVFDPQPGRVTYVDAGHGYAIHAGAAGQLTPLNASRTHPVGILPDTRFESATAELAAGDRVLIVSDGIIEQPRASDPDSGNSQREEFSLARVREVLGMSAADSDAVARLFAQLDQFAGGSPLADDATAVLVTVSPEPSAAGTA